jgi:hypothetical protein
MHPIIWPLLLALPLGLWASICVTLSRLGGWAAVAQRYPAPIAPEGTRFRWQSAGFRWVDYNGGLTMIVSPEGLYISICWFFRLAHPAMLLPWSALHVVKVRDGKWIKDITVAVDEPSITRIRLPLRVVEAAQGLLPARS